MSTPSSPLNVLLVGASGTLGSSLASGFLAPEYKGLVNLSILVREVTVNSPGPKAVTLNSFRSQGARFVFGDISQPEAELAKALRGQDVIVSAVGATALGDQSRLLSASKLAGAKWFVPSEFGGDLTAVGQGHSTLGGLIDPKIAFSEEVKKSGLAYTIVYSGLFGEYALSPFTGTDVATHTITAPGSFSTRFTVTPLADIGVQLADAIVTGKGRNQTIHLGTATLTYNEYTALLEKVTGTKWTRKTRSIADFEAAIKEHPEDFQARFGVLFAQEKGTSWPLSQSYATKNGIKSQGFEEFATKTLNKKQ